MFSDYFERTLFEIYSSITFNQISIFSSVLVTFKNNNVPCWTNLKIIFWRQLWMYPQEKKARKEATEKGAAAVLGASKARRQFKEIIEGKF